MKSSKQVVLGFNESNFNGELAKLRKKAKQLTNSLELVKKITDGNVQVLRLRELNDYLNNATGFKNPMMSADALNVKSEYIQITNSIPSSELPKFIELKGDTYLVEEDNLRESLTSYMNESYLKEYNTLLGLVSKLNNHSMHILGSISMRGDSVTIDPLQYNTRKQIA